MSLTGKKILLGISGSIAAYKAAFLTRLFIKEGAEVKVVMTPASTDFITPLTLSTLSKHPVHSDVSSESGWNNHVELGLWADAMVIAPATATTLAKMANGICDNMLLACYLSARCPVFFAPAMDLDMWTHPATSGNVQKLISYGHLMLPVEDGELASGLVGKGRMAEPENIVAFLSEHFDRNKEKDLQGKKALVSSGPTYEAIDPVRFIGNHSTGKMGFAIAEELASRGAEVIVVSGPTHMRTKSPSIQVDSVKSAQQMYEACIKHYDGMDIVVLAAAVADYRPINVSDIKIKKKDDTKNMVIELEETQDIAKALGKRKAKQINIGFALETNDALQNAQKKLIKKNFDFIVLNSLQDKGAGFGHDTNKVCFVDKDNNIDKFELKSKRAVAIDIVNKAVLLLDTVNRH